MYNPSNFWGALQRGRGCVTPAHNYLKSKATTLSRQKPPHQTAAKHLIPARAPHHNTPLNPLSRGETSTPQISHYQQKSNFKTSPLKRGQGVCHACAKPPKIKSNHPIPNSPTVKTTEKNTPATTNPNQKSLYLFPLYNI